MIQSKRQLRGFWFEAFVRGEIIGPVAGEGRQGGPYPSVEHVAGQSRAQREYVGWHITDCIEPGEQTQQFAGLMRFDSDGGEEFDDQYFGAVTMQGQEQPGSGKTTVGQEFVFG